MEWKTRNLFSRSSHGAMGYREGFGAQAIGVAQNPLCFDARACAFLSFPSHFGLEPIRIQTPTCVFGSFPCGMESFPYGNDCRQVHEPSTDCSDTRFFHVELSHFHMEITHLHMVLSPSEVVWGPRRFISGRRRLSSLMRRMASRHSDIAPCRTDASWQRIRLSLARADMATGPRNPSTRCGRVTFNRQQFNPI